VRLAPLAVAGIALLLAGCSSTGPEPDAAADSRPAGAVAPPVRPEPRPVEVPAAPHERAVAWRARSVTHRRLRVHDRPGGRVLARLGTRTQFGSPRVLGVAARRPGWVAVRTEALPNGRPGWVPARDVQLTPLRSVVEIDLSARRLLVRRDGKVRLRGRVAVGRPEHPTPTGTYAVTDRLRVPAGTPYGCCVIAISGRQPHVPQGWIGGDRLAIHGTADPASIGTAASLGCMRAAETTMRRLMASLPLGTPVRIRA
jgi:lipoprotein-anchoring transpeptidase ErfK/SrfK